MIERNRATRQLDGDLLLRTRWYGSASEQLDAGQHLEMDSGGRFRHSKMLGHRWRRLVFDYSTLQSWTAAPNCGKATPSDMNAELERNYSGDNDPVGSTVMRV